MRYVVIIFALIAVGCTAKKEEPVRPSLDLFAKEPLTPDETKEVLAEAGENWLYSPGVGSTALDVGGVILFPPYAAVILGNSLLEFAGYESIRLRNALPKQTQEDYDTLYEQFTSGPGRVAALVADEEFRSKAEARERMKKKMQELENKRRAPKEQNPRFFEDQE